MIDNTGIREEFELKYGLKAWTDSEFRRDFSVKEATFSYGFIFNVVAKVDVPGVVETGSVYSFSFIHSPRLYYEPVKSR